ncbi:hypothetical protein AURDEDRAFT_126820 [Auricularia subglabra TFB-10046 SS5]|nr:hypothetical protein AURDEDRAFT_126820 [Auricularia subglabra TFB-10046 SS5]
MNVLSLNKCLLVALPHAAHVLAQTLSGPAPGSGTQTVLFDPGPRYHCYSWDGGCSPTERITSGCGPFLTETRVDFDCQSFGATYNGQPTCPTWKFDPSGGSWCSSYFRANSGPRYDAYASGGDGSPLTVTLVNNAKLFTSGCLLYEIALSYEYYTSSIIKTLPGNMRTTLDLAPHFFVEYDVLVYADPSATLASQSCAHQRRFLTTDFIYWWPSSPSCTNQDSCPGKTNLLSINHFNPTGTPDANWNGTSSDGGCRHMAPGVQNIREGVLTHVSLDFKALIAQFAGDLCHPGGPPAGIVPQAVQIVSSNIASDMTVQIANVNAVLASATAPVSAVGTQLPGGQCGGSVFVEQAPCTAGHACGIPPGGTNSYRICLYCSIVCTATTVAMASESEPGWSRKQPKASEWIISKVKSSAGLSCSVHTWELGWPKACGLLWAAVVWRSGEIRQRGQNSPPYKSKRIMGQRLLGFIQRNDAPWRGRQRKSHGVGLWKSRRLSSSYNHHHRQHLRTCLREFMSSTVLRSRQTQHVYKPSYFPTGRSYPWSSTRTTRITHASSRVGGVT